MAMQKGASMTTPPFRVFGYRNTWADSEGNFYLQKTDGTFKRRCVFVGGRGYCFVQLIDNGGTTRNRSVAKLICRLFHGEPPEPTGYTVRHIDGNRANNRAANLEWRATISPATTPRNKKTS